MWLICVHGGSHKQTMLTLNPKDLLNQLPRHCISPNEAMKSQLETVWCFLLRLSMIINLYIYIIYNYKWLFLTIPSLPSFSHPQGHWQFHRTKCDLNWPFDNFKSLSAEHQPPHRQLSSVPLLAWSTLLKLSAALRKSPVATQRNQAQDWLEKWQKCKRTKWTIQTWNTKFLGKPPESETQSKISMCTRSKANW